MDNKQPSMLDLLIETHIGLERQGPGSPEVVTRALSLIPDLPASPQIADLGCGTGSQTLSLAQQLPGTITGLDLFPAFIDAFCQNMREHHVENRVTGMVGSMDALPFAAHSLDLIWSEGAIDNIGFENGLSHWHGFLKTGGYVAVSSPSWLTDTHPEAVERFWTDAGSRLDTVADNIRTMQACGYQYIASFTLPKQCWTENYFDPRAAATKALLEKYPESPVMQDFAEQNRYEEELYAQYHTHYGYVFYIGKAL